MNFATAVPGLSFVNGYHNPHKVVPVPGSSKLGDAVALPSLINHDYLVLEVGYGSQTPKNKLFIRAEKAGNTKGPIGILLTVDPNYEATENLVRLLTIPCNGVPLGLPELLAILADHSPDYSLRNQNCWQYTRGTAKRVLQKCSEVPGLGAEDVGNLLRELNCLEARIAKNHIKSVVRNGKKGFSRIFKIFG